MKIWIDGRVVERGEARIPVTDHGLLYGDGIFEGLRLIRRRVFRLPDHLARIEAGARALGLAIPGGIAELEKIVFETARAFGEDDAYLRLVVTRGDGELGVDPMQCSEPRVFCIADRVRLYPEEKLRNGIDMLTSSLRRPASDALDPRIKSLNYLNSVLAKREARLRGCDEALILNQRGHVAEASVANVFCCKGGVLRTPPVTDGSLEGITRASVLELASRLELPAAEETLGRYDLIAADEVFLTGTGARLVPVATLDGSPIGRPADGAGSRFPIAARLSEELDALADERGTSI